jgi:tetratricopeptide (TPR) repeat protein
VLKRDTVGTFEARLRWTARWRWLAPALAVAAVVAAAGTWLLLRRSGEAGAARAQADALALVALDDGASLDDAAARLADVVRRSPKLTAAAGDRALALVLRAAALADERDALAARLSARNDDRERLRREMPDGWERAERAAAADVAGLEPEVRGRDERALALAGAAADQLRAVRGQIGDTPEVLRAFAALHVFRGERDQAQRLLRAVRERGRRDPWLDLADGWLDARDGERAARERALVKLGALASSHPDILRGRYLLARAEGSLGRRSQALATLDKILAANPSHEAAKRLRAELSAPPPPAVQPPAPPPAPPPAVQVLPLRRKLVPQRVPGASAPPSLAPAAMPPGSAPDVAEPAPPAPGQAPPAPGQAPPAPPDEPAAQPNPPVRPADAEPAPHRPVQREPPPVADPGGGG